MGNSILDNFYHALNQKKDGPRAKAVAISGDGKYLSDVLDEKPYNHAVSFNYFASSLGLSYFETTSPKEAADNLTSQGVLALQVRDGICVSYFPDSLTEEQYLGFHEELEEYENLLYVYDEREGLFDKEDVLNYAKSLLDKKDKKSL